MLSHLRFHRRGPSNPSSPAADQQSPWESAPFHDHPHSAQDTPHADSRPQSSSNSTLLPPTLPQITRGCSTSAISNPSAREDEGDTRAGPVRQGGSTGFMNSFRRGGQESSVAEGAAVPYPPSLPENQLSRARPTPPPIYTGSSTHQPGLVGQQGRSMSSFVTPTDLQQHTLGGQASKRPAGGRMASESAISGQQCQPAEVPKGKKRLPFFKTQVASLLTRNKPVQPAVEPEPLGPKSKAEQPAFDPRIRGTRVHDFSAPRKKAVPSPLVLPSDLQATLVWAKETEQLPQPGTVPPEVSEPGDAVGGAETRVAKNNHRSSLDKALPPQPPQHVMSLGDNDSAGVSFITASPTASRQASSRMPKQSLSSRTNRTASPRRTSTISALPRHMKSTSSRFSFDIVGAAKQEKLLEERHRQREAEKKTTEFKEPRDSRFDEFDEESFDYDAMIEDNGLEERIPGVNADADDGGYDYDALADDVGYEDEEVEYDPDNDQENFAGFVFQRSNPTSTLASPLTPGILATPRYVNGNAVGFAVTKDTDTPAFGPGPSPFFLSEPFDLQKSEGSGLGIQEPEAEEAQEAPFYESAVFRERGPSQLGNHSVAAPVKDDEIYFDDGLADELSFQHDGTHLDESIFDLNDTDQYGRPIPGAFAEAKTMMTAQPLGDARRESDLTADMTAQTFEESGVSHSTAHTSISAGVQSKLSVTEKEDAKLQRSSSFHSGEVSAQHLLYQAALAEAAQKAEASGKFRRSSSPSPPPPPPPVTSPMTVSSDVPMSAFGDRMLGGYEDNALEDYEEDDGFGDNGMDDYELDDDEIIAEANAEALANDSDGWYGQEFGFYSAPLNVPDQGRGYHGSSSVTTSSPKPLTLENLYQYANGGYFGPSGGLDRTKSGRIVSREPNLTPITEMSEYSNRNSIMSLGVPPAGTASVISPGLAQLAMMEDDGDLSFNALLRLRSKTFGGSQASLVSSGGGAGSPTLTVLSPQLQTGLALPPPGLGPSPLLIPAGQLPYHPVSPAFYPLPSRVEEEEDDSASQPHLTSLSGSPVWTKGMVDEQRPTSPTSPGSKRPSMGHRHKGSADSISYIKDDESGETRWILERRRTAETGEVKILEREVVEGGRI